MVSSCRAKSVRRRRRVTSALEPSWISDPGNQRQWNARFRKILARDYVNLDSTISAIVSDDWISQQCANKIRAYVDRSATAWWYRRSKRRGADVKDKLRRSVDGLRAAVELCESRGDLVAASFLARLVDQFSLALGRYKQAFATKPHGRDRDHSFLLECSSFLERALGQSITYVTLANLVNAAFEADRTTLVEPISEEHLRKNLDNFRRNNAWWALYRQIA
jgi:hypothetical protein